MAPLLSEARFHHKLPSQDIPPTTPTHHFQTLTLYDVLSKAFVLKPSYLLAALYTASFQPVSDVEWTICPAMWPDLETSFSCDTQAAKSHPGHSLRRAILRKYAFWYHCCPVLRTISSYGEWKNERGIAKKNAVVYCLAFVVAVIRQQLAVSDNFRALGVKVLRYFLYNLGNLFIHNWSYVTNWIYVMLSRVRTNKGQFLWHPLCTNLQTYAVPKGYIKMMNNFASKAPSIWSEDQYRHLFQL